MAWTTFWAIFSQTHPVERGPGCNTTSGRKPSLRDFIPGYKKKATTTYNRTMIEDLPVKGIACLM
jgi:hypothetical protein